MGYYRLRPPFLQRDEAWVTAGICQTAEFDDFMVYGEGIAEAVRRDVAQDGGGGVGASYAREVKAFDKLFFAGPSGLPPVILFKDAPLEAAVRAGKPCLIDVHIDPRHGRSLRESMQVRGTENL